MPDWESYDYDEYDYYDDDDLDDDDIDAEHPEWSGVMRTELKYGPW